MPSDLANEVGGETIESNPRIVVGFLHHPSVSGMKAVALRNLEAEFALHVRDLWRSRGLWTNGNVVARAKVAERHDQKEHQEDK